MRKKQRLFRQDAETGGRDAHPTREMIVASGVLHHAKNAKANNVAISAAIPVAIADVHADFR